MSLWNARTFFLALLFPMASAFGAAPDWLVASLAEPAVPRNPAIAAITLLDSREVRYLSIDQTTRLWRGAVKIVLPAGLSQARVVMTYNADIDHILSAEAWVVSPGGKRIKSYGRANFIDSVAQYNKYFWDAERVIQFDGSNRVEAGGVLAWEIQLGAPSGIIASSSSFLSNRDIVRGRFEVIPPPGGKLEWHATSARLGLPTAGSEEESLVWTVSNLPPRIAGRPAEFIPNPLEISVRCLAAGPAERPAAAWPDQSRLVAGIMEPSIGPAGEVKARAEALIAGKSTRWERIRALTEFTQREIVYLEITLDKDCLAGYRPHPASEVLRNRYGDCKDKAALLVSLLRAIGEDGHIVLLTAGNPTATSADWPSLAFNHAIVAIPADASVPKGWPVADAGPLGKWVIFDPTDPVTPLGVLSPMDQGGFGLIVDARRGALVRMPTSDAAFSSEKRRIKAQVDTSGNLTASVEEDFQGLLASEIQGQRFVLGEDRFKRTLEARLQKATPLAQNLKWSDHWEPGDARYRLNFNFTAERYVQPVGGDMMMITPRILGGSTSLLPWRTAAEGVAWLSGRTVEEEVRLSLPDGVAVEELPDDWSERQATTSGDLTYRKEGREIVCTARLTYQGGLCSKKDYEALRMFFTKIEAALRRPIILQRPSPPAS